MLGDDAFRLWEPVEWNLREKMVFGLVLHATHHHQPPEPLGVVVAAGTDLMVNKGLTLEVSIYSGFSLVISDQHMSRIKSSNKHSDYKLQPVSTQV